MSSLAGESASAKEAYSSLAVLLYEAARVDADSASLKLVFYHTHFDMNKLLI